ncbi:hypothetical protein BDD12DRAFT_791090 [Trichophaea hybrida]|nr:hypothetical protein BDD12DRAFT_791090 [Trichophaea hybrida]
MEGGPKPDPAYLRAFRAFVKASANNDAFVSRAPRFDAIQAHRICTDLRDDCPLQAACLPNARRLSNSERSPIDSRARQREASEEIMTSLWALMAGRWLNFGKMIVSPAHEQLLASCMHEHVSVIKEKRRVLDLGGAPVADWGWHCAVDYPKVKVYTVTERSAKSTNASPMSPTNTSLKPLPRCQGPKNHRHLAVERLYRLPFPDNHFDVVSARTLFLTLKCSTPLDSTLDEYDRCLGECMRVLKPGGYFEYQVFDSDVINAGPLAAELFARFSAALEASGRDPEPTKRWITRSTKDVAAVGGLLGGWVWEKWLRSASIVDAETVGNIIEEARECGSGLRSLCGYARKPSQL